MKVSIFKNPTIYSSNVYVVRGDWNKIDDINTLIDVGADDYILKKIETLSTGVGKSPIEQVIFTHEHFDHTAGLKFVLEKYKPKVYAFAINNDIGQKLSDGEKIKIGDRDAIIYHTPGHSNDSICIYVEEERVLFTGDTPINIKISGGTYSREFLDSINRLKYLKIDTIYSGHDLPITKNAEDIILNTINIIKKSKII